MTLIYAGIDEAGYGPLLGPLCVGLSVIRVDQWTAGGSGGEGGGESGGKAPNLWELLDQAVCRAPRDARRRIAIDDSKNLKLANSSVNRHPLCLLERGVAAFLACQESRASASGDLPASDLELFSSIGARLPGHEWYAGEGLDWPCGSSRDELKIVANTLRRALANAEIMVAELACEAIGEREFNDIVERAGTKAAVTERALVKHLRTVWERFGAIGAQAGSGVRVVCDRQGGRTSYVDLLQRAFPGCAVVETHATQTQSRYEIASGGDGRQEARAMGVLFMVESEAAHLPVALASMLAKLTRELMMARFNRFWCGRMPELKPTAGYRADGWRWLEEASKGGVVDSPRRAEMVRRA